MTQPLRSYTQSDHWRHYQRFLPQRARLDSQVMPVEQGWAWGGGQIHLDRYAVPNAPLTVVLLHGGGGHARLMTPFAVMLRRHGYEVVVPDLPGYGLSVVPDEQFAYDRWVDCTADLVAEEVGRTGRPTVLFGMSLGGYLAYQAAARCRCAAGVIATTMADPRQPQVRAEFARNKLLDRLVGRFLPGLAAVFGGLRVPIKWLGKMNRIANDVELTRLICADPQGGATRTPLRFLHSVLRIQPVIEPEQFDLCPVLMVHPAEDRWTSVPASRLFFDRIGGSKELVLLEGCGHYPIEEPGFGQMENAVTAFLRRRLAG